jgi:putative PIN family toxin of toxin-antitoxin system
MRDSGSILCHDTVYGAIYSVMLSPQAPRVVIDTNVLFEGLTKRGGAAGLIINAWHAGLLCVCVSTAVAYEYMDVLSRKLSASRWQQIQPLLGSLLAQVEFVSIYYSWRPASPDAGDDHVIDCAMNGRATIVTANVRDFRLAQRSLGVRVMTPVEMIQELAAK